MTGEQAALPAQVRTHLWIAQIGHPKLDRTQTLRAQALAARGHTLPCRLGRDFVLAVVRGHHRNA
jgi:hypothetical protein